VWKTEASFLCCIGPREGEEHVVRSAARLATHLNVEWTAVYVETPALQRLPSARRERILRTVKLAQELGANTAVLSGSDAGSAVVEYARSHNISKPISPVAAASVLPVAASFEASGVAGSTPTVEIARGERVAQSPKRSKRDACGRLDPKGNRGCCAMSGGRMYCPAHWLTVAAYFDPANIVMLFLLTWSSSR
jgi:two-component system sensor histidine kinase KdpD